MKQIKLIANALLGIAFCLAGTSCQTDAVSTPTVTSLNEAIEQIEKTLKNVEI